MKNFDVFLMPDALADLTDVYEYIASKSGLPEVAMAYIQKLRAKCENLSVFPMRGNQRDDLRKNLRILALDKSAVVAFQVDEEEQTVTILNIFYGGRDYETIMGD